MNETEKDRDIKDSKTFISVKIQKLTAALYLVTDFLPNSDPLKWKLRDKALEILSEINTSALFDSSINSIGQMISLIDVALTVPGVSQMNFSLLKKEYENLQAKMFGAKDQIWGALPEVPKSDSSVPRLNLDHGPSKLEAKSYKLKAINNSRRETILKFIREHGWSSIKDIAQTMPEVSAKTVQRELVDMVSSGILKKEGDRRWSRYELASR